MPKEPTTGPADVDAHLARVPEPQRTTLTKLRATLRKLLPDAQECLKYGMPCFTLDGKAVAGYDAFKAHCSYFPHSGGVLERLADVPVGIVASKGTLQFPVDRPLPEKFVRQLVRARLDEIAEQDAARRAKRRVS